VENRDDEFLEAFERLGWNASAVARDRGVHRSTAQHYYRKLKKQDRVPGDVSGAAPVGPIVGGRVASMAFDKMPLPAEGKVRRYLLTCAQNNTHIHERVWRSLQRLRRYFAEEDPRCESCEIWVATVNYNIGAYGRLAVKRGQEKTAHDLWYAPEIRDLIRDAKVEIAPSLVWCGDLCLSVTAQRPLNGWTNYTRRKSGIFPHPKVEMESVATSPGRAVKFNYTTGAITLNNYIQKAAGQRAEFHHVYGALLVEVASDGTWWCRQVVADSDTGVLQDLNVRVDGDEVDAEADVEAITWGDIHAAHLDPEVARLGWRHVADESAMLDVLRPSEQHVHDLLDFYSRNHWDRDNPRLMFRRWVESKDDVGAEVREAASVLHDLWRPWCKTVVVNSNHDRAMLRWLDEADGRRDPVNARLWIRALAAAWDAVAEGRDQDFVLLEWACRDAGCPGDVVFLREDQSWRVCGDIECGLHGDRGPNGSRGGLHRIGERVIAAHSHTASIRDGVYNVGTSSLIPLPYAKGPSSWSHSHVVTYPSGKRTVVSMYRGRWRA